MADSADRSRFAMLVYGILSRYDPDTPADVELNAIMMSALDEFAGDRLESDPQGALVEVVVALGFYGIALMRAQGLTIHHNPNLDPHDRGVMLAAVRWTAEVTEHNLTTEG